MLPVPARMPGHGRQASVAEVKVLQQEAVTSERLNEVIRGSDPIRDVSNKVRVQLKPQLAGRNSNLLSEFTHYSNYRRF